MKGKSVKGRYARFCLAILAMAIAIPGMARMVEEPKSFSLNDRSLAGIECKVLPGINREKLLAEDRELGKNRKDLCPQRYAIAIAVAITPSNSGRWQDLTDGSLWRLRIQSPGAVSLSLGISRYELAKGVKLWIYDPGLRQVEGPYTSLQRSHRGTLWTPLIAGAELVVELFVPSGAPFPQPEITLVNRGYRGLLKDDIPGGDDMGACNNDVVCPEGAPWQDQIRAVAVYTFNDGLTGKICTGTMLNDTAYDFIPYFLSAYHCGVDSSNDHTVVVYWNFQATTCGAHSGGSIADSQVGGSVYRAGYSPSDFSLLELSTKPDPGFNVYHAGWDASGSIPTATVTIHHPQGDVKAISFSNTAPTPVSASLPINDHWEVVWDSGVTEDGSSGAGLFETGNGRLIGQLHSGFSACTGTNQTDYFGMLSVSWTGGGTSATGLKHWLDPGSTGALAIDGDPHVTTANGSHYDFQGGGEFVVFRTHNGLEVQTRQTPIATTFNPGADPYDGLATCVSLNTAVALRAGGRRITYEPNLSGVPDPGGLQLRLDGVLTTLAPAGRDLGNGARLAPTSAAGGLRIDYGGSAVIVTPGWWAGQSCWYLNVGIVYAPAVDGMMGSPLGSPCPAAAMGLMGAIAPGSWLPALPDGTSLGPMPSSLHQRYVDLYQRFGEAWRVTAMASLFDYAPGTSTDTFTIRGWPPENPPCRVAGMRPLKPAALSVAERACRKVSGKNRRADCVFDVRVTGDPAFARTYLASQKILANLTRPPRRTGRLAAFLDLGAGIPQGTFANITAVGLSLDAGLEYMVNSRLSTEAIFAWHHFPDGGAGRVNVGRFSANAKLYFASPGSRLRPFVNGGLGVYGFSPGSVDFGANAGCGIFYGLTPRFGLQVSYNFHVVNSPGAATCFSTLQGGFRLVF
jgi:lysyl endopeptidase